MVRFKRAELRPRLALLNLPEDCQFVQPILQMRHKRDIQSPDHRKDGRTEPMGVYGRNLSCSAPLAGAEEPEEITLFCVWRTTTGTLGSESRPHLEIRCRQTSSKYLDVAITEAPASCFR